MLQQQVYERFTRGPSGGQSTDEDRWDYDFVTTIADGLIAWAKQQWQIKYRKIPSQWLYSFEVMYDETIQDDECYKQFPVPNAIIFAPGFTAINVGSAAGEFMSKYNSFTELDAKRKHQLFRNKKGVVIQGNTAYVYSEMDIDRILVEACVANLNDLEVFNPDFDDYRVTDEVLVMAEQEAFRKYMAPMAQKTPDIISNGKDTPTMQPQRSR